MSGSFDLATEIVKLREAIEGLRADLFRDHAAKRRCAACNHPISEHIDNPQIGCERAGCSCIAFVP